MNEEVLGGIGFSAFFLSIVSMIIEEDLIKRSPRGQTLNVLLGHMKALNDGCFSSISVTLISACNTCLLAGSRYKLPSLSHAAVWAAFHISDRRKIFSMHGMYSFHQLFLLPISRNVTLLCKLFLIDY